MMDPADESYALYRMTVECQGHGFNDTVCQCRERIRRALEEAVAHGRVLEQNPEYRNYAKDLKGGA